MKVEIDKEVIDSLAEFFDGQFYSIQEIEYVTGISSTERLKDILKAINTILNVAQENTK